MSLAHSQESPTLFTRSFALLKSSSLLALLIGPLAASPDIAYDTLEGLIQKGASSFSAGDYGKASESFQTAYDIYGKEPDWKEARLSEKILPLSGFASLKAGLFDRSIATFSLFLDEGNYAYSQEIFVRYALTLAYQKNDDINSAIAQCQALQKAAHSESLKSLAAFRHAQLLLDSNNESEGMELLLQVAQSEGAFRVRQQARLLAIRESVDSEQLQQAYELLRNGQWDEKSMPELALLSITAMEIGDQLLEAGQPSKALWCYQQVLPLRKLVQLQGAKLNELKQRFQQRQAELGIAATIWEDFYKQILLSLQNQLEALENTPDYEPYRQLRKGKCYLLAGRPREAWLVFEGLVQESSGLEPKARYFWMLAARDAGYLPEAVAIGNELVAKYPNSPDAFDALRMIGFTLQDQEKYREAIEAFTALTERAPNREERDEARFQIAYCYAMRREYPIAISLFEELRLNAANAKVRDQSHLWIGLVRFFQTRFSEALSEFTSLHQSAQSNFLKIESAYRSANCLFALSRYREATDLAESLLDGPEKERTAEIRLLAADARKALGEWDEALAHYLSVPEELVELYHHASIGAAEILMQDNRPVEADTLLTKARDIVEDPNAICENALVLADARVARKQPDRALAALHHALQAFGNHPEVEGSLPLIDLLHHLSDDWSHEKSLLFNSAESRASATLAARLALHDALFAQSENRTNEAEAQLIALANAFELHELPPECLAHASVALVRIGSPFSEKLAYRLIDHHPHSQYVPFAYYTLGERHAEIGEHGPAIAWLSQIGRDAEVFPIYLPARMREAKSRTASGEFESAKEIYESLLQNRSLSNRSKAEALSGIAELYRKQGNEKAAIASYQRLYTLYAAYPEFAADAYYQSAAAFDRIGRPTAAIKTIDELVSIARYKNLSIVSESLKLKSEILERHPELDPETYHGREDS